VRGRVEVEVRQGGVELGEGERWLVVPPREVEGEVWWGKEGEGDWCERGDNWGEGGEV
jgi:hypothetical protein